MELFDLLSDDVTAVCQVCGEVSTLGEFKRHGMECPNQDCSTHNGELLADPEWTLELAYGSNIQLAEFREYQKRKAKGRN